MEALARIWRRVSARRSAPLAGALVAAFVVAPIGSTLDPLVYAAGIAVGALSVGLMDRQRDTLVPSFLFLLAAALLTARWPRLPRHARRPASRRQGYCSPPLGNVRP